MADIDTGVSCSGWVRDIIGYRWLVLFVAWVGWFGSTPSAAVAQTKTYQTGSMLYLDTGVAKIGVDVSWGGAITDLEKGTASYVNRRDKGREVQFALWDGNATYDSCGGCTGTFGWNPVQAGDRYNHPSTVLSSSIANNTVYTKTQPLEWYPDNKGGGSGKAVADTDVTIEQWITAVPNVPQAFRIHYKTTYSGSAVHGGVCQEFPAVYANGAYQSLVYYGGDAPWTGGQLTTVSPLPEESAGGIAIHASERWAALVNTSGNGLTVYAPAAMPYASVFGHAGSGTGPSDDATYYFRLCTSAINPPSTVQQGDAFLIAGAYPDARTIISNLRATYPPAVAATGYIASPPNNQTLRGALPIVGWAIGSNPLSTINVLIDHRKVLSITADTVPLSEVQAAWPRAPPNSGFQGMLDTTTITNGTHILILQAVDSQGNTILFGARSIAVLN